MQIGLTPDVGVIVAGLEPGEADLLPLLDGTRDTGELVAAAGTRGLAADRVRALVEVLGQAGVLTGAPTDRAHLHELGRRHQRRPTADALAWSVVYPDAGDGYGLLAQRSRHRVWVVGSSRLATATRAALDTAGLQVEPTGSTSLPDPLPSSGLVLLVGDDLVGAPAASVLLGAGVPHLAAVAGADRAVVGPLVVPGRSACLRCLELHRTDRDPLWPTVAAQLALPPPARGEATLTELVAHLVALQACCWVDQRRTPASLGATLTVTLPDGLTTRRAWSAHPRCGCSWLAASLPATLAADGFAADR